MQHPALAPQGWMLPFENGHARWIFFDGALIRHRYGICLVPYLVWKGTWHGEVVQADAEIPDNDPTAILCM